MRWQWVFTLTEFQQLWTNETGQLHYPEPLNTLPRGHADTEQARAAVDLTRFTTAEDAAELSTALKFCLWPQNTTAVITSGTSDSTTDRPAVTVYAVTSGGMAAILNAADTTVTLTSCPEKHFGQELVAAIGSAPAGNEPARTIARDALLNPDILQWHDNPYNRNRNALRRLLQQPATIRGDITITVEPQNPMSPPPRHCTWLDLPNDGRYLFTTGHDLHLTPIDDTHLAHYLNTMASLTS